MKKLLLIPLAVIFFTGCSEDDEPRPVERFAGSWSYESNELSVYFDLAIEGDTHNFHNRRVVSAGIPADQEDNNQIQILFDENGNCEVIEIVSRGPLTYHIYLFNNSIDRDGMHVSEMFIDVPGYDELSLYNQIFRKK